MERVVNTFVQYKDTSGRERIKKTKQFDHQTNISKIKSWISTWWKHDRAFDLEIKDEEGKFVDFDDGYIIEYEPFHVSERTHPTISISSVVELRIVDMDDNKQSLTTNDSQETSIGEFSASMHLQHQASTSIVEQPSSEVHQVTSKNRFYSACANRPITIDETKTEIGFTINVSDVQRDQYSTDKTYNAATRQQTGYYVRIQGDKTGRDEKARHGVVLPKFKISDTIIPENERSTHNLLIFLVYEICENGKRKFYHHEERQFITNENAKMDQSSSSVNGHTPNEAQAKDNSQREPIILHITDKMSSESGESLELKTTVMVQTKTHPNAARLLFCELTNEYSSNISYETTRLASVPEKNGNILWDYLIFSNAMIFPKSTDDIGDIEIKDNNGRLIEKIPVRIMKRKKDLNQSSITKAEHRDIGKKAQQNAAQTDISNPGINQGHQVQTMHADLRNQVGYSISATGRQFQDPNFRNEYVQHHHMVPSHSRIEDPSNSQYTLPPMMMDNCTNEYLQNQSATTAMNPYGSQTENPYYYDASLYQQQESSSRESSSLPSIQTLLTQPITNNPLQGPYFSNDDECFTDTEAPY